MTIMMVHTFEHHNHSEAFSNKIEFHDTKDECELCELDIEALSILQQNNFSFYQIDEIVVGNLPYNYTPESQFLNLFLRAPPVL